MLRIRLRLPLRFAGCLLALAAFPLTRAHAQQVAESSQADQLRQSVSDLQQQIRELQAAVADVRTEAAQYRAETRELRGELEATRAELRLQRSADAQVAAADLQSTNAPNTAPPAIPPVPGEGGGSDRLARLEEQYQLLTGKIDEQYQTKIESASKYRVRLSGIVLLNLFDNAGNVDNADFPALALQPPAGFSGGSFGGTLRQSQLGLEVFGPHIAGARTTGDLQFDFAGGFPNSLNGVSTGLVRLRTGTLRLDWTNTSVVAGQDGLFFSPLSPTSFASLATPALGYAGNLWNWTPQVRVEHRFILSENSRLLVQGGILDPVSGEPPANQFYRQPQAGELSRQPAVASRVAWTYPIFGQPLTIGAGGYYSAQDYGFGRTVDGWAAMSDWDLPLGSHIGLSGEFYRGRAIGGLGGGIGRSVLFSAQPSNAANSLIGLNSIGGWSQVKVRATPKLEFNAALGQDNPYAADVRHFVYSQSYFYASLVRNRSAFANVIYRPRSDLLFSAEFRRLRTFTINDYSNSVDHINLMMGVLF